MLILMLLFISPYVNVNKAMKELPPKETKDGINFSSIITAKTTTTCFLPTTARISSIAYPIH